MLFHFLRQLRSSKSFSSGQIDVAKRPRPSQPELKIETALRQYAQRFTYRQKKMGLIIFCASSGAFFTWLLMATLQGHPFGHSTGISVISPALPILSDTHSLQQLWPQHHVYSDSINYQSLYYDTVKIQ